MQKNEVRPLSLAIFKKKKLAQWIKDLNLRTETIRKQWGGGRKQWKIFMTLGLAVISWI